jgi:hypothetical protein
VRKRKDSSRDQRKYLKEYRKTNSIQKRLIPGISGRQSYLTASEESQLFDAILLWRDPLNQPSIGDMPNLVSPFFLF